MKVAFQLRMQGGGHTKCETSSSAFYVYILHIANNKTISVMKSPLKDINNCKYTQYIKTQVH